MSVTLPLVPLVKVQCVGALQNTLVLKIEDIAVHSVFVRQEQCNLSQNYPLKTLMHSEVR